MNRRAYATLDQTALIHNYHYVQSQVGPAKILSMVKGNAYGHDAVWVARSLLGSDGFGVATLTEAQSLREAGITQTLLLMSGVYTQAELKQASSLQCDIVVHHKEQLKLLSYAPLMPPVRVWLKVNIGMNRLGFAPADVPAVVSQLQGLMMSHGSPIILTHFPCADETDHALTMQQYHRIQQQLQAIPLDCSFANSAAIMAWPQTHAQWVRPGIMLYGVVPFHPSSSACPTALKPVMSLYSRVVAINPSQRGDRLGYGGLWCCPEDMRVGIVSIGYGDGYPRQAAGAQVYLCGQRCDVIGLVSMDLLAIDLRPVAHVKIGDQVELWGRHIAISELAEKSARSAYDLLTGVNFRVPRLPINPVVGEIKDSGQ